MSWFETVKNVAKTAAENAFKGATTITTKGDTSAVIASAVPDTQSGWWSVLSQPSSSGNGPGESSHSESDSEIRDVASGSASQVTTRARFTYELDRFEKNAMLIFVQMKSDPSAVSRIEETTTQDLNALIETLAGFRFEANTHIDLTCSEIENKCQEFFHQDFTQFGAVVVVVLTCDGTRGQLSAQDGQFSESIILRHFTYDLNQTLLAKPKIYITEANRISSGNGPELSESLEGHQDVLGLNIPTIEYQAMIRRPLMLLCDNIKNMADNHDLVSILKKSIEDLKTESNIVFENKPIEFSNNLTKEVMLARS